MKTGARTHRGLRACPVLAPTGPTSGRGPEAGADAAVGKSYKGVTPGDPGALWKTCPGFEPNQVRSDTFVRFAPSRHQPLASISRELSCARPQPIAG